MATTPVKQRYLPLSYAANVATVLRDGEVAVFTGVPGKDATRRITLIGDNASTVAQLFAKAFPAYALNNGLKFVVGRNFPDMPDSAAGITYKSNWLTDVDGWGVWVGGTGSLAVSGGALIWTPGAGETSCLLAKTSVNPTGKTVRVKVDYDPLITSIQFRNATVYLTAKLHRVGNYYIADLLVDSALSGYTFIQINYSATPISCIFNFIYVGTGAYAADSALDYSGNGAHGTIYGCTPVDGREGGKALSFDGVNDYVLLDKTKFPTTGAFTVAGRVQGKESRAALQLYVSRRAGSGNRGFYCGITTANRATFSVSPDGTSEVGTTAPAGTELTTDALIVCVFAPGVGMYIYKNGSLIASNTDTAPASVYYSASQVLTLGSNYTFADALDGWLSDVRLYDRALSASEIWDYYQNPSAYSVDNVLKTFTALPLTVAVRDSDSNLRANGLRFPGTQVAHADPNTLDDYEEGTFTPTIIGTTAAGAGTYSVQEGGYTKIGRKVFFRARLTWSAHTGTGNMKLSGLPFTAAALTGFIASVEASNLTFPGQLVAEIDSGAATASFKTFATGAAAAALAIDTAASVMVTGMYNV